MVFCSSVWFDICVVGFLKLNIDYTRESLHVKLKNVRIQKLNQSQ